MKIVELSPEKKQREDEELKKKIEKEIQNEKNWNEFRGTVYYKMVLDIIEGEIENSKSIESLPQPSSISDFSELGQITAIQMKVYYTLKNGILKRIKEGG